jgi:tetratricopeptide (TPR) repeat protein
MAFRYLFGPVSARFADQFLLAHRASGDCLAFDTKPGNDLTIGPRDSWEEVCARFPAGWRPEFAALFLRYTTIPSCLENPPLPVVGLAGDANLLWHYYRLRLPTCDLVLSDTVTVQRLAAVGITHARVWNLYGCERDYLQTTPPLQAERDIDILFVGNFRATVQGERRPWLGRLAALGDRWNVVLATNIYGAEYRALLARARVAFNRGIRSECNSRAVEATVSGALLFQEAGNCEMPTYYQEGREYVAYRSEDLEHLLDYYLEHEAERSAIAEAGRSRAQAFSFADQWAKALELIKEELPKMSARQRPDHATENLLRLRTWQRTHVSASADSELTNNLEQTAVAGPGRAGLHHCRAVTLAHAGADHRPQVVEALRQALQHDPLHVVARLHLAEVLLEMGQKGEACEQARQALAFLEHRPHLPPELLDAPQLPPAFDCFSVEWERAAWDNAGRPLDEQSAKHEQLRGRLHALLAAATGDLVHYYEAVAAWPNLGATQAAIGCALARSGRRTAAVPYLRRALLENPFDLPAGEALYETLGHIADWPGQHRLARTFGLIHKAAPRIMPSRDWFAPPRDPSVTSAPNIGTIVWEGDFQSLHSLSLINRALCAGLVERGCNLALRSTRVVLFQRNPYRFLPF